MRDKIIIWLLVDETPSVGGPYKVALLITDALQKQGLNISILSFKKGLKSLYLNIKYLFVLLKSDAIVVSGLWSLYNILLWFFTLTFRKKVFVRTCGHLMPIYEKSFSLRHRLAIIFYIKPMLKSTRICHIFNSKREYEYISSKYRVKNYAVVPNCFDPNLSIPSNLTLIGERFARPNLIYYARINRVKNLMNALKTYHSLAMTNAKIKFTIAGPIHDNSYYEECLAYSLSLDESISERISFIGPLYSIDEKYKFFKSATLNILPTKGEGFPNSIVETLACSIPSLTTIESNFDVDVLKSCGLLISDSDHEYNASLIRQLLGSLSDYTKISNTAYQYSSKHLNIETISNSYRDLLTQK